MSFAAGRPANAPAIEEAAKALFRERHKDLNSREQEKLWTKDERQREICMETARVNADLRAFVDKHGTELLGR